MVLKIWGVNFAISIYCSDIFYIVTLNALKNVLLFFYAICYYLLFLFLMIRIIVIIIIKSTLHFIVISSFNLAVFSFCFFLVPIPRKWIQLNPVIFQAV